MGRRYFGTDGVRGLANKTLTAPLAMKLGSAAAKVLTANRKGGRRPVAVVGRDPRVSGEMLSAALSAGMASQGVDVLRVGVSRSCGGHDADPPARPLERLGSVDRDQTRTT